MHQNVSLCFFFFLVFIYLFGVFLGGSYILSGPTLRFILSELLFPQLKTAFFLIQSRTLREIVTQPVEFSQLDEASPCSPPASLTRMDD